MDHALTAKSSQWAYMRTSTLWRILLQLQHCFVLDSRSVHFEPTASFNTDLMQPFPISPNNSVDAVKHLMTKTGTKYIIGPTAGTATPLGVVLDKLRAEQFGFTVIAPPELKKLIPKIFGEAENQPPKRLPPIRELAEEFKDCVWDDFHTLILHSSGSTDHPKPIALRQKALVSWFATPWFGEIDFAGTVFPGSFLPPFHVMGVGELTETMTRRC